MNKQKISPDKTMMHISTKSDPTGTIKALRAKSATLSLKPVGLIMSPDASQKTLPNQFRIRQSIQVRRISPLKLEKVPEENHHQIDLSAVKLGKVIGKGSFGEVYVGFLDGRFLAVKALHDKVKASVENEIEILSQLKHRNIVKYYGSQRIGDTLNIYLEYMDSGSIADRLKQFGKFKEQLIKKFTIQILDGLEYLHNLGIVHRDLKGANILTNKRGHLKLCDFGASRWMENQNHSDTEFCSSLKGSFQWMAPELLSNHKHGRRIDIWSLGCVIIEMATAEHPWNNCKNYLELVCQVNKSKCPPLPQNLSQEAQNFIKACCTFDKNQRPKAAQLKQHPWLNQ